MSIENHHREAQAPQKQPDDIEQAHRVTTPSSLNDMPNQPPVYIEGAGTSQYGPGTAPNTRHRKDIHPLDRKPDEEKEKRRKRIIQVAAGTLATATVVTGVFMAKSFLELKEIGDSFKNLDTDPGVSAPEVPGEQNTTNSMYDENGMYDNSSLQESEKYDYGKGITKEVELLPAEIYEILVSTEDRIEYVDSILGAKFSTLEQEFNEVRRQQNRPELGQVVEASELNSGQQILDRLSLLDYGTSIEKDVNTRLKLTQSIIHANSPTYENMKSTMERGTVIETVNEAVAETPVFYNTTFNKVEPTGNPMKVVELKEVTTGDRSQAVFTLVSANEGSSKEWVIMDVKTPNDPNWKKNLSAIAVN